MVIFYPVNIIGWDAQLLHFFTIERRIMINVFYYFLQSNALDFMQIVAFHAFDALIPNHVFRCILLVMLCKVKDLF